MDNAEVHSWKFIVVINYWREHFEIAKEQLPSQTPMDGSFVVVTVLILWFVYYSNTMYHLPVV